MDMVENAQNSRGSTSISASEVMAFFQGLRYGYHTGDLSLNDFRNALHDLVFRDIEGNLWTIGASSGKWYRRLGNQWVIGIPLGPLTHSKVKVGAKHESNTTKRTNVQANQILNMNDPITQQLLRHTKVTE